MQYKDFLDAFGEYHSFQTFCDKGKNKKIIKQLHGTIAVSLYTSDAADE